MVTGVVLGTGTLPSGKKDIPVYQIRRADGSTSVIFVQDAELVCYTFDGLLGALRLAEALPQPLAVQAPTPADPTIVAGIWGAGEGHNS